MNRLYKLVILLLITQFFVATVHADTLPQTPCKESSNTQSGSFRIPPGKYKVFIKNDGSSDTINIHMDEYDDLNPNHCTLVAENIELMPANTEAGHVLISKSSLITWYVQGKKPLPEQLNANRIRLFLVPDDLTICLTKTCTIDNTSTSVTPVQNNPSTNRVLVSYYVNPTLDVVKEVSYYADETFIFTKDVPVPFPKANYQAGNIKNLMTVTKYKSGQVIISTEHIVNDVQSNSLFDFFKIYIYPYIILIEYSLICVAIIVILYVILIILRAFYIRRQWKISHGYNVKIIKSGFDNEKVLARNRLIDKFTDIKRLTTVTALLILTVILVNFFVVDMFTVSGHSMDTTLHDGGKVLIFKLPVSVGKVLRKNYLPSRGSVVVATVNQAEGAYQSTFGNGKKSMIKRVVGLPGDRIIVKDNIISVYRKNHDHAISFDQDSAWSKDMINTTDSYNIDIVLGINEVFVAGDNRGASIDSRINGPIDSSQIIGLLIHQF